MEPDFRDDIQCLLYGQAFASYVLTVRKTWRFHGQVIAAWGKMSRDKTYHRVPVTFFRYYSGGRPHKLHMCVWDRCIRLDL